MKITGLLLKFIFCAFVLAVGSCSYDKRELPQPEPQLIDTIIIVNNCDTTDSVTYTNFVKSIIETNCTAFSNCHASDAPPGFDYTTYAFIKDKVVSGKFQLRVFTLKDMPVVNSTGLDSLDDCTLLKLQKWVNNGAPE